MMEIQKYCVSQHVSLYEAIEQMEANGKGFVVVVDESLKALAILLDPDVRRLNLKRVDFNEQVILYANKNYKYWHSYESKLGGYAFLKRTGFRQLPVLDEQGKIVDVLFAKDKDTIRNDNPVVIMAGGLGKRLRPLTEDCPKPMLHIRGKPVLERIIESLISNGFYRFIISVNYLGHVIEDYLKDGSKWGIEITYIRESKKLGTAGSLGLIPKEYLNMPVLVMNGDVLTRVNHSHLLNFHLENNDSATMCVRNYDIQIPFGVVREENGVISKIEEKPLISNYINAGIYCLNPEFIELICGQQEVDMPDIFKMAIDRGMKTHIFPVHENWIDIGSKGDHQIAENSPHFDI